MSFSLQRQLRQFLVLCAVLVISILSFVSPAFAEDKRETFNIPNYETDDGTQLIDRQQIMDKANSIEAADLIKKSRDGSFNILVVLIVVAGILLIIGAIFKTARKVAVTLIGCGFIGFFLINYTEDVMAFLMFIVNEISSFI